MHPMIGKWEFRRLDWRGSAGDQNDLGANEEFLGDGEPDLMVRSYGYPVWIEETCGPTNQFDAVFRQIAPDALAFAGFDTFLVVHQLGDGGFSFEREVHAVQVARFEPGESESRFTQGLAGQGTGIGRATTQVWAFLNHQHSLAQGCGGHSAAFAGWSGTNHDQVERFFMSHGGFRIGRGWLMVRNRILPCGCHRLIASRMFRLSGRGVARLPWGL